LGLDDPIERRRGEPMTAQGIYRDPGRSSHAYVVKVRGLRWRACMGLAPLAWADRVWARPFLTVLGPSERCYAQRGRHQQPLMARARPMIRLRVHWWPGRGLVCVADSNLAALALLDQVTTWPRASLTTRRRLDAALYAPAPHRQPGTNGRPRLTGKRRPTLEAVLVDERTPWPPWLVAPWSGAGSRQVAVATDTAGWYHTGPPPVAIRWVLIRAPKQACKPQAFLSTNLGPTSTLRLI
jgi:hypothetical protein